MRSSLFLGILLALSVATNATETSVKPLPFSADKLIAAVDHAISRRYTVLYDVVFLDNWKNPPTWGNEIGFDTDFGPQARVVWKIWLSNGTSPNVSIICNKDPNCCGGGFYYNNFASSGYPGGTTVTSYQFVSAESYVGFGF